MTDSQKPSSESWRTASSRGSSGRPVNGVRPRRVMIVPTSLAACAEPHGHQAADTGLYGQERGQANTIENAAERLLTDSGDCECGPGRSW